MELKELLEEIMNKEFKKIKVPKKTKKEHGDDFKFCYRCGCYHYPGNHNRII